MPSLMPTSSNGYAVTSDTPISVDVWNAVLGDVDARLEARETLEADFEALIAQGVSGAIAAVQVVVGPQVEFLQGRVTAIDEQIALAEDRIALLQAGGIDAESVRLDPYGDYPQGTDVQTAFSGIVAAVDAQLAAGAQATNDLLAGVQARLEEIAYYGDLA